MKNPKHSSSKPAPSSRKPRHDSTSHHPSTPSNPKPPKPSNPNQPTTKPPSSSPPSFTPAMAGAPSSVPPPLAAGGPGPPFSPAPMPPPLYGFQDLERRTIVLLDGSVRSYFALPHDYTIDPFARGPHPGPEHPHGLGFDGFRGPALPPGRDYGPPRDNWSSHEGPSSSLKRKFPEEDYGNPNPNPNPGPIRREYNEDPRSSKQVKLDPPAASEVDPQALKKAFLRLVKTVNENASKKNYLENGKFAPLQCVVCGRASKEFPDVHQLIYHAYNAQNADSRVDHLGLHKALCILMGWDYTKAPDNYRAYQSLSLDDASMNREDLIVWPPTVIIHNTNSGRRKDGRMDGFGNKDMDMRLKELGYGGGKSKSMYGKEGHLGFTVVKFANTLAGLREAEGLAEYFEKDNRGRKGWARAEASKSAIDEEKNPSLVRVDERSGEKKRIFYGYLATASDLEKFDFDLTKRAVIKSRKEFDLSD